MGGSRRLACSSCASFLSSPTVAKIAPAEAHSMAVLDAAPLAPVILVTSAWGLMYYAFMQLGPASGMGGYGESQKTWGSRTFGNLQEQSIIFIVALWLYGLFMDAGEAAHMGWAYLAF